MVKLLLTWETESGPESVVVADEADVFAVFADDTHATSPYTISVLSEGIGEKLEEAVASEKFENAIFVSADPLVDFYGDMLRWTDDEKWIYVAAVRYFGYAPDYDPCANYYILYDLTTFAELAELFVDDGLFGEISENLTFYIDYEALGDDLRHDYSICEVAGITKIVRFD